MAVMMKLSVALCLLAVCVNISQAYRQSINDHLIKSCLGFIEKKREEGFLCDSEVIDHVHDYAEGINAPGYDGDLVEDYLDMANARMLCYLEGNEKKQVKSACAAMELVCNTFKPTVVDRCSKITPAPPTETPTTTMEAVFEPTELPEREPRI